MDGEAPECGWANINQVATSMKEMGPGSRKDVLNNHFGDANWKKKKLFQLVGPPLMCSKHADLLY